MAYSEKQKKTLTTTICKRMAKGESLASVLRDEGFPSNNTFNKWRDEDEEILTQYLRAREARETLIFEQCLDIADATSKDIIMKDGQEIVNNNVIARDKLRIDTRLRMLGKMNAKKYGDKMDLTSGGEVMDTTPSITIVHNDKPIDLGTD